MRASGTCSLCGTETRQGWWYGREQEPVLLDAVAAGRDGDVAVVGWAEGRAPIVSAAEHPSLLPARYNIHRCPP